MMTRSIAITTDDGTFHLHGQQRGKVLLCGDSGELARLEAAIRRRHPDFNLGLSEDVLHRYNAACKLSEAACALVLNEVFRRLTRT